MVSNADFEDFELQLKAGFLDEARQLLAQSETCFLELEKNPADRGNLEHIFRIAHSFKGSAAVAGFTQLSEFAHHVETLLTQLKARPERICASLTSILLRCNDQLRTMIDGLSVDFSATFDLSEILRVVADACPDSAPAPRAEAETVSFFFEDAPAAKGLAQVPAVSAKAAPSKDESIRVSLSRIDRLVNDVGELVILQTVLAQHRSELISPLLQRTVAQLSKITKDIQSTSMSLRMLPLKQTFLKMQRTVRDTALSLGKDVNFVMNGENTEIDKTVLDLIGDPLVHIVRNAVDHGIEDPAIREQQGKPSQGCVKLSAMQARGQLVIEIRDDGAGLDPEKLKAKAINKGLLKSDCELSDTEAYQLIFAPGFSTKDEVTGISGRGVGMDVVKSNVTQLQGDVQIESVTGSGTTIRLVLPLGLAIIDAMVVLSDGQPFVVPMSSVHESVKPAAADLSTCSISTLGLRSDLLAVHGETVPLHRLSRLLGSSRKAAPLTESIALIVRDRLGPFGVVVDDIIGQQQVVIKRLGDELNGIDGVSGAAILGDGRAALIIDLCDIVEARAGNQLTKNPTRRETA